MTGIVFRPGLRPNDPAKPRLLLGRYLQHADLPQVPAAADWDRAVSAWGVLGNDSWGDCDLAMQMHTLQTWTANAGTEVVPTVDDTLRAYSDVTGFDPHAGPPGDNPTDQGTVMQDGLTYWRKKGMLAGGIRHRILAFAEVDVKDPREMAAAVALFGEVLLGLDFPDTAMDQFNAGEPWTVAPGARSLGGHAVCSARYDQGTGTWWVITWGREQEVTAGFIARYATEAWVAVGPEWIRPDGTTPAGIDTAALGADFTALTGEPSPFSPPVPPGAAPFPDAAVAAVRALVGDPQVAAWLTRHHVGLSGHVADLVRAVVRTAKGA